MDVERLMWSILGKVLGKVVSWEGILANFLLGAFLLGWHREKKFVTFEKISSSKRGGVRTAFGGACYDNGLG